MSKQARAGRWGSVSACCGAGFPRQKRRRNEGTERKPRATPLPGPGGSAMKGAVASVLAPGQARAGLLGAALRRRRAGGGPGWCCSLEPGWVVAPAAHPDSSRQEGQRPGLSLRWLWVMLRRGWPGRDDGEVSEALKAPKCRG